MLYTDPGSGVLLWQALAAGAVGALFYVRKIFSFFRSDTAPRGSAGSTPSKWKKKPE